MSSLLIFLLFSFLLCKLQLRRPLWSRAVLLLAYRYNFGGTGWEVGADGVEGPGVRGSVVLKSRGLEICMNAASRLQARSKRAAGEKACEVTLHCRCRDTISIISSAAWSKAAGLNHPPNSFG